MPLPTEATIEAKMNICKDRYGHSSTNEDHTLFQKVWMHASRHIIINTSLSTQIAKRRQADLEWEVVNGSQTSATI